MGGLTRVPMSVRPYALEPRSSVEQYLPDRRISLLDDYKDLLQNAGSMTRDLPLMTLQVNWLTSRVQNLEVRLTAIACGEGLAGAQPAL